MRISPKLKLAAVNEVLKDKKSLVETAKKYGCSRQALAGWVKSFKNSPKKGSSSFSPKYLKGKKHHKKLSWKVERAILDLVIKEPELGVGAISKRLLDLGFKVSGHGVYNVLLSYELQTKELRRRFSVMHPVKTMFASAIGAKERVRACEEHLNSGKKVVEVCRKWNISRPTFYSWLLRYKKSLETGGGQFDLVNGQIRSYKKGSGHKRWLPESARELVLDIVRNNPQYSAHKIHEVLTKAEGKAVCGHHGIQNLLFRENLNTIDKRREYARGFVPEAGVPVAPLYAPEVPLFRLRQILSPFVTVPKEALKRPKAGIFKTLLLYSPFFFFLFWLKVLFGTPGQSVIGLFFATIALTFGLFFFIYSMKYYVTILLVLKLARSGGQSDKETKETKFQRFFSKLGIRVPEKRVNPLLVNLEQVKLDAGKRPFVSIHVALYNEKRVVERLMRATTGQEWHIAPSALGNGASRAEKAAYEVVIADDSTDETTEIAKKYLADSGWSMARTEFNEDVEIFKFTPNPGSRFPVVKLIHRFSRSGFKGAALQGALEQTDPRAKYITIFDADFVPYADTLEQFVKSFEALEVTKVTKESKESKESNALETSDSSDSFVTSDSSKIAAVQGYQWHVLNKSQTWVTRGVRTEYAGSYVIERAGEEIYGGLKQISGSVYAIRADVLRQFGWGTSITEDFELTLRLYEAGYKVAFTPYIQAPAEAVSTIKRLIRQRMRWAEGASFNVKVMFARMLWGKWEAVNSQISNYSNWSNQTPSTNDQLGQLGKLEIRNSSGGEDGGRVFVPSKLSTTEKLEFAYLAPYYLQAAFFVFGTLSWFIAEAVLGARLPFWTAAFGWSLVFTNMLSLPLMNIVGLFLEESEEKDYVGILAFVALSYIVVPFQAYAAIKGFLEKSEGPWFRTPKTGMVTDTFGRSGFTKFFGSLMGSRGTSAISNIQFPISNFQLSTPAFAPVRASSFRPLQGNGFAIKRRHVRWTGNLALGIVILLSTLMSLFAPFIPGSDSYAYADQLKTVMEKGSENEKLKQAAGEKMGNKEEENFLPDPKNPKHEKDVVKNAMAKEIEGSRAVSKKTKDGQTIDFIFSQKPKVRIKIDNREIEFETKSIGGRGVDPKKAKIIGDKEVIYEEILPDIDLQYTFNGDLLTENFVVKTPKAAKFLSELEQAEIVQSLRTVDIKVISPDSESFGFYTEEGEELFKLSAPFAKDSGGQVSNDFGFKLDKDFSGKKLVKTIGQSAKVWLLDSQRAFPIYIDPSVVVAGGGRNKTVITSGGIANTDIQFGGLQRKLVYVSSANAWYAFYNDDNGTFQHPWYKKCLISTGCDADGDWGARVDMDSGDIIANNYNISVGVSGGIIHAVWFDDGNNRVEGRQLDTSTDTLGTKCNISAVMSAPTLTSYTVSVASYSTTAAVVAFSDTSTETNVDVYNVTGLNGACTSTDVNPGNIIFGSGITASDRPVLATLSSTKVGMVFQDGNLSYSELDTGANDWTTNNLTIASVTDNIYSVVSDQAATPKVWILTAAAAANDTNFYTCCSPDVSSTTIDADAGAAGQDNVSDLDMYCPSSGNCKIVYTDDIDTTTPDLIFVDCNDETCSAPVLTTMDNDIGTTNDSAGAAIYCVSDGDGVVSDNCKVTAANDLTSGGAGDLLFYDCVDDEDCSTNTIGTIDTDIQDGTGTTVLHSSIYCVADDDCKVVYNDEASGDLTFADCNNADCSSLTMATPDGGAGTEPKNDISCATGTGDCKIVYHDAGTSDFSFIDCSATATCTTVTDVDGVVGGTSGQVPVSIWCPASDGADCRLAYGAQDDGDFHIVDCGTTACGSATITTVDSNGGADASNNPTVSIDCVALNDCKAVYVGDVTASSQNLYILDCDANACTTGSVVEIGSSARYGAVIKCPATDNCKIAYYGGGTGTPTVNFIDCASTNCFPTITDDADPWTTGTDVESVSLTYDLTNSDLYAHVIKDASDQAYYISSDATTVSWGTETSYAFTAGTINEISAQERAAGTGELGVVVNQGSNYEASLAGNVITEAEVQFGGLQRKLVYASNNWYAFYNDNGKILYKKSSDGSTWGSAVDVDATEADSDNYNPSVWLDGTTIYVAWIDVNTSTTGEAEVRSIDTSNNDALGTKCETATAFTLLSSFMISVAAANGRVYIAWETDGIGGQTTLVYSLVYSGCTFSNISSGSGMATGGGLFDPVLVAAGNVVHLIFQDGQLSSSTYTGLAGTTGAWFSSQSNQTIEAITDTIYSPVADDQTATTDDHTVWNISVSGTTAVTFNSYKEAINTKVDTTASSGADSPASYDIYCPTSDNCKILYNDMAVSDITFVDCNDMTCSNPTSTVIDTDGGGTPGVQDVPLAIYCPTSDNCKGVFFDGTDDDQTFFDCANEGCTTTNCDTPTNCTDIETVAGVYAYNDIDCPASNNCKVAFGRDNGSMNFADCNDETCSAPTKTILDSNAGTFSNVSMDCVAADDCKVVYNDYGGDVGGTSDVTFIDCNSEDCTTRAADVDVDTEAMTTASAQDVAVYCLSSTDCKVLYSDLGSDAGGTTDLQFVNCENTDCSSVSVASPVDVNTNIGSGEVRNAIYCPAADDCKLTFMDRTNGDMSFVDCNNADCSSSATSDINTDVGTSNMFGAIYCSSSTDCKVVYGDDSATSDSADTMLMADCNTTDCSPFTATTSDADPWTAQTNVTSVSLSLDTTNNVLYANVIKDTSEQAYYKSTSISSISWSGETSWAFTAGDLGHISSNLRGAGQAQIGVVLRQNVNFEFATVPERMWILMLGLPFAGRYLRRGKTRNKKLETTKC